MKKRIFGSLENTDNTGEEAERGGIIESLGPSLDVLELGPDRWHTKGSIVSQIKDIPSGISNAADKIMVSLGDGWDKAASHGIESPEEIEDIGGKYVPSLNEESARKKKVDTEDLARIAKEDKVKMAAHNAKRDKEVYGATERLTDSVKKMGTDDEEPTQMYAVGKKKRGK